MGLIEIRRVILCDVSHVSWQSRVTDVRFGTTTGLRMESGLQMSPRPPHALAHPCLEQALPYLALRMALRLPFP